MAYDVNQSQVLYREQIVVNFDEISLVGGSFGR